MTNSVASDPNAYVLRYRTLVERLEAETDKKAKAKLKASAGVMKAAWKKWQGEDSLYEMAFGEYVPVDRTDALKEVMRYWLGTILHDGPKPGLALSKGEWFTYRMGVDDSAATKAWRASRRPRSERCFQNSREYCLAHPDVRYYEGFYLVNGKPQDHAWIVTKDGRVLDFTVEASIRKLIKAKVRFVAPPPVYLGIEVPRAYIVAHHGVVPPNKSMLAEFHARSARKPAKKAKLALLKRSEQDRL